MKLLKFLYLGIGLALLVAAVWAFDFKAALGLVGKIEILSFLAVIGFVLIIQLLEALTWQSTIPSLRMTHLPFTARVLMVRMVGEAFNRVIPAGTLGGEPLKAVLLKRSCAVNYHEGVASLYTVRVVDLAGQLLFVLGASVAILLADRITPSYKISVALGIMVLCAMLASLVFLPHSRLLARIKSFLRRRRWGARAIAALSHIEDIEDRILNFRRRYSRRFYGAVALSVAHWTLGSVEVYLTFWALGHPIGISEAVMIEAVLQLVRSVTFFIPGNLGSQEGAYVLFGVALTGTAASVGLGAAIVRRIRELILLLLGFGIGAMMSVPLGLRLPAEKPTNSGPLDDGRSRTGTNSA